MPDTPTREPLEQRVAAVIVASVRYGVQREIPQSTAKVIALVREQCAAEIRAEWQQIRAGERPRPLSKDAVVATDYATDFEWAALIAEGATNDIAKGDS